jgi:outer membrane protein TolC
MSHFSASLYLSCPVTHFAVILHHQTQSMKRFIGSLLLMALVQGTQAQVKFGSLQEVLQYADKNSLVNRQSQLQQQISHKDEQINKSGLMPKVNVFGTADYYPIIASQVIPEAIFGGSADKFRKVQFGLPWSFTSGVELSIPVINFEKWEQLKRFKLQTQQTNWTAKVNTESLHIQVTQSYYQALMLRELVQLNKANQQVGEELIHILEKRKSNGVLNPADFNRSKNLQLDIQNEGIEYEKNYRQALIALKQLLNLSESTQIQLTDSINATTWQQLAEQTPITDRPAFKEAEAKKAVAEQQVKESKKASLPKIALNSKYTYQWQMDPANNQHTDFDFSSVGLRLDVPVFQGNFYKATRQKSELQLQLAQTAATQTANDLTKQQAEWWNNYTAAVSKQQVLQQKLDVTSDNLRIARLNMQEGVMEFDEFNNIFLDYLKTQTAYLQNTNDGIVYRLLLTQKL